MSFREESSNSISFSVYVYTHSFSNIEADFSGIFLRSDNPCLDLIRPWNCPCWLICFHLFEWKRSSSWRICICIYTCFVIVWQMRTKILELWGAGGTVVVHVSLATLTCVRFRLHAVIWLKLPWSHMRRVLSSLTLPSTAGFLRVLQFPPVVTLDPWGVALTGLHGRTAKEANRVIQYN